MITFNFLFALLLKLKIFLYVVTTFTKEMFFKIYIFFNSGESRL